MILGRLKILMLPLFRNRRAALVATACASAFMGFAPAHAQQAGSNATQLGEVIVTARKRQESILNVPVVESAIPQEQLQRYQTQDLKDIATLVPGIALGDSILSIGTQISIRGVGTTTFNPGIDQSVALNIDGLQLSQGLAYSSAFFDMQQVEVLKGPQALFYGKASPGGVISIRTADPTSKFEVIARAAHEFEADENQGEFIISGPLTDTLKGRLAAQYDSSEGYFENLSFGNALFGSRDPTHSHQPDKNYMIRGTLLWNPTSAFDARLKINQARDRQEEAGAEQAVLCPEGTGPLVLGPGFAIPFMSPNDDCKLDRQFTVVDYNLASFPLLPNNGTPYLETTQTYGTLEMNYRVRPDITLTSTTGYYLLHSTSLFNTSQTGESAPIIGVTNGFHRRELTEELRANSDFSGPLNFTTGIYIQRAQFSDLVNLYANKAPTFPFLPYKGLIAQAGIQTVDINTNSFFGQVRYKIIPQVEIAAGARYSAETRTDTPYDLTTGVPIFINLATPEIKSYKTSPEVTITYKPTDDMTFFGALKKGYKSGSFDTATPPTPDENNAFGDEKVEGGEVGMKSRWLDRSLLFNIAWYDYRYSGLQVGAIQPVEGGLPVIHTINAGSALVTGWEGDVDYRPDWIAGLNLHASANWNHAVFKTLDHVSCFTGQTFALGCTEDFEAAANNGLGGYTNQNQSGLPLVRAPKYQANFGFDYEHDIGNGLKFIVANNTQYSSKYMTGLGFPYYQGGFFKTDINFTLQGPNDRWEFALIAKNLNDKITTGNCSPSDIQGGLIGTLTGRGGPLASVPPVFAGPAGLGEIGCWADRGREIWMRVTLKPFN
jgi:iron complex outermembrane receptor protein